MRYHYVTFHCEFSQSQKGAKETEKVGGGKKKKSTLLEMRKLTISDDVLLLFATTTSVWGWKIYHKGMEGGDDVGGRRWREKKKMLKRE